MKKLQTMALAFATVSFFAACSSDDSTSSGVNDRQQAIGFSTYLGRNVTRGTIIDNDNIKTQGVGVFAMYTNNMRYGGSATPHAGEFSPNFMENVKVSYDANSAGTNSATSPNGWTYNPVHFWPNSATDYVSFFAYAPYSESTKLTTSTGETTGDRYYIKHEVNATPSAQVDLLRNCKNTNNMQYYYDTEGTLHTVSDANNQGFTDVTANGQTYKVVNLDMIHACARVAFVVTSPALINTGNFKTPLAHKTGVTSEQDANNPGPNTGNATITVNKVALLGDNATGDASSMTGAFYKEAYLRLTGGVTGSAGKDYSNFWANKSTNSKQAFSFSTFADGTYKSELTETSNGKKLWVPDDSKTETTLTGTMTVDNNGDATYAVNSLGTQKSDYLFIIPQDFTGTEETSDKLYCYIEYTVKYADAPAGTVKSNGVKYKAYGQIKQDFKAGGAYVIEISIGDGTSLNPIHFTVNVENWADEEAVDVKL